jgi:surface antigen
MRMRWMMTLVFTGLVLGVAGLGLAREEKTDYTIKQVMKEAMKGGLLNKVATGEGEKEDSDKLVALLKALASDKPPKGDPDSWKEKTSALLKAAKDGDGKALKKAADCKACHAEHKGK